ncbi:hypothetical protein [Pseudotabrizicola sp. L79]|uniref:hypothetical protein n=1 Tax=Pseudotabrizicola sp. L79 TaxID=3118402 RepID=UPI002F936B05
MKNRRELIKLANIAKVIRDAELQKLAQTVKAHNQTKTMLLQLGDQIAAVEPKSISDAILAEHHDLWRLQRRIILNKALARQTAEMLNAKDRASKAFGRAQSLNKLSAEKD